MPPRVMFSSCHCLLDPSNGAAISTRDLLTALAARGWQCGAFTGPVLDDSTATPIGTVLRDRPGARHAPGTAGARKFVLHTIPKADGFPVTVFAPDPPAAAKFPDAEEAAGFLAMLGEAMRRFRPQVVLTYGGDPASRGVVRVAKRVGARVVFRLHNFAYPTVESFAGCDVVAVPSVFSREHHRVALGLDCAVVRPVINVSRVVCDRPDGGRFVTFVNPDPNKGVFWFARLAEVLGRTRPDIPLLVVEARGKADWLGRCGVDLRGVRSISKMANTPDPRQFYRLTRTVVVPSVWRESFGRVAAEAMLNGIPVVASDRGALPEVVGSGGVCLPIPAHVTPDTRTPPLAEDVRPWVDAVLKVWDDPTAYAASSAAAREASAAWHPDTVVPQWERFLTDLARGR